MKKIIWSLLLLLVGVMMTRAQVNPLISTNTTTYEYYVYFPHLGRYAQNGTTETTGDYVINTSNAAHVLRVKLVESATEGFVNVVATNVDGKTNYFIGAEGTNFANNTKILYSATATANCDWKLSTNENTKISKLAIKGAETVALANGTSTNNKELILYTKNNSHSDISFYAANADAIAAAMDITTGIYKIKNVRRPVNYLSNNHDNSDKTVQNVLPTPVTNNFYWKVTRENGANLTILNAQGTPIKVNTTSYIPMEIITVLSGKSVVFKDYINGDNYECSGDNANDLVQPYSSDGIATGNQWTFEPVTTGTAYTVNIVDCPGTPSITKTETGEQVFEGGFFYYAEGAPAKGDFTVPSFQDYSSDIDITDQTITVTYKLIVPQEVLDLHTQAHTTETTLASMSIGTTYVGQYSAEKKAVVVEKINDALNVTTLDQVSAAKTALESAMADLEASKTQLQTNKAYAFLNGKPELNEEKSMFSQNNDLKWGNKNLALNSHYWVLENGTAPGTYIVKNGDGTYIGGLTGTSANNNTTPGALFMTERPNASNTVFDDETGVSPKWYIKVNGNRSAHANSHGGGDKGDVICWQGSSISENGPSFWYILPISDSYDAYTVVVTGLPEGSYGGVTRNSSSEKAFGGGFFLVENNSTAPTPTAADFTAIDVPDYESSPIKVNTEAKTITVQYTLLPLISYNLTDVAGNVHEGTTRMTLNNDEALQAALGFTLENITWNGSNVSANITFPFAVSKVDGATNMIMISSYADRTNLKWYADGTSVKLQNGETPTSEKVISYLWAIYPSHSEGVFSFTIKNIATGKYIYSEATGNTNGEGHVTLKEAGSALTLDNSHSYRHNQFKLPTGKYLSTYDGNATGVQYLSTWGSHDGTGNNFPTPTYKLTISSVGAATLYTPFAVTIPEGVTAKYVKAAGNSTANGGTLYYTTLEGAIPANTAVVLLGNAGDKTFNAATESVAPVDNGNVLFGYSELTEIAESDHTGTGSNGTVYALGNNNGTAVFGHFTGTTYKAGKAYLDVASLPGASNDVRYFYIFDEDTETGIDNVTGTEGAENGNSAIYDMSGRRVNNASKGIYIINGKKVIK